MKEEDFNQIRAMAMEDGYPKAALFAINKREAIQKEIDEVRKTLRTLELEKENCLSMIDTVFDHMKEFSPEEYNRHQVEGRGVTRLKFIHGNTVWDVSQDRAYPDNICCRIGIKSENIDIIEINE